MVRGDGGGSGRSAVVTRWRVKGPPPKAATPPFPYHGLLQHRPTTTTTITDLATILLPPLSHSSPRKFDYPCNSRSINFCLSFTSEGNKRGSLGFRPPALGQVNTLYPDDHTSLCVQLMARAAHTTVSKALLRSNDSRIFTRPCVAALKTSRTSISPRLSITFPCFFRESTLVAGNLVCTHSGVLSLRSLSLSLLSSNCTFYIHVSLYTFSHTFLRTKCANKRTRFNAPRCCILLRVNKRYFDTRFVIKHATCSAV